jgi:hypothetical protein
MRPHTKCSKKDKSVVIFVRGAAVVTFSAVILAVGGCPSANKSVPLSTTDGIRATQRANTTPCVDETPQKMPPSLPDFADCTRIEVAYYPSTLRALGLTGYRSILNADETRYLESLKTIVINDPNRVRAFTQVLRCGSYEGSGYELAMSRAADVVCYRGAERLLSFRKYPSEICTQDGHWFQYQRGMLAIVNFVPEIYPLYLRGDCASKLYRLGVELRTMSREGTVWPASNEWCDALFRRLITSPTLIITDHSRAAAAIAKGFTCPGAGEGKCHYAMNPACKPDSPPDMVLLFEAKAGWNQHGGSEVFTFDHHDPKGGLVLLNNGKVKFIRTEEELKQLRWK